MNSNAPNLHDFHLRALSELEQLDPPSAADAENAFFVAYERLARAIGQIVADGSLGDEVLHQRALRILQVLDIPEQAFVDLNKPHWVRRIEEYDRWQRTEPFTIKSLYIAMLDVADDLHLPNGKRYVSAAICSCEDESRMVDRSEDEDSQLFKVAETLSQVASIWVAYLLWPCELLCMYSLSLHLR